MPKQQSETLSRKKAYMELDADGFMFRIRKGNLTSAWCSPSEIATFNDGERVYFCFREPMSAVLPMWKAETIYMSTPCKTNEKTLTESEVEALSI